MISDRAGYAVCVTPAGTRCPIHPRITSNTSRQLFSNIAKWLFPRILRFFELMSSARALDAFRPRS